MHQFVWGRPNSISQDNQCISLLGQVPKNEVQYRYQKSFFFFVFCGLTFGFPSCVGEVFGEVLLDAEFTEAVSLVGDAASCPGSCVEISVAKEMTNILSNLIM